MTRSYHSPSREAGKHQTRESILEALVDIVVDEGIHAFSVQHVADRAGVSHRTVYRHFDDRDGLLEALNGWLDDKLMAEVDPSTPTLRRGMEAHELPGTADRIYRAFAAHERLLKALVVTTVALDVEPAARTWRTSAMRELLDGAFPHLDGAAITEAAAAIRLLVGSRSFYLLRRQGVDVDTAARSVHWAVETLLCNLADRDREAADG